jgi:hypothetical protein
MSAACAVADPNPARTELRVATLDAWARAGLALATRVLEAAGRDIAQAAHVICRISQAVRLAIALAMRLSDPTNPAFQPTPAKPRAARAAGSATRAEKARAENESAEKPERAERIGSGDREVSDAAILRRPLIDIVKVICRNLGIVPDWSLWADAEPTPAAPPPERPRPKPIPQTPLLQGVFLHRALGRRLIWISPNEQAPAPTSLRTRLRSSCASLALDPLAPRRAVAPACPDAFHEVREPSGSLVSTPTPSGR